MNLSSILLSSGSTSPPENEEKFLDLTVYKPEDQVFQRLHLCKFLAELLEVPKEKKP